MKVNNDIISFTSATWKGSLNKYLDKDVKNSLNNWHDVIFDLSERKKTHIELSLPAFTTRIKAFFNMPTKVVKFSAKKSYHSKKAVASENVDFSKVPKNKVLEVINDTINRITSR